MVNGMTLQRVEHNLTIVRMPDAAAMASRSRQRLAEFETTACRNHSSLLHLTKTLVSVLVLNLSTALLESPSFHRYFSFKSEAGKYGTLGLSVDF